MKTRAATAAMALGTAFLVCGSAAAAQAPDAHLVAVQGSIPAASVGEDRASQRLATSDESRAITVTGDAEVRVVPDEVVLTLGVQTWHRDVETARGENDRIVQATISLADAFEIDPQHVQTDYISIEPRYRDIYEAENFIGYFVRKTIVVRIKDLAKFEDFLAEVLKAGVNYVHGIEFRTTELREHRDRARALAIKAASEKAAAMAREAGLKTGEAVSIHESHVGWWSWYGSGWWGSRGGAVSQNVFQSAAGEARTLEGGIAPGQITVSARVTMNFALEP